jgi:hypothetical protein
MVRMLADRMFRSKGALPGVVSVAQAKRGP